jgi:hypothetical protein
MLRKIGRAKARPARITAKQRVARRKNIAIARSHRKKARKKAGSAFKKEYKKSQSYKYTTKSFSVRRGHTASVKASKSAGAKLALKFASGYARRKGYDKKGARQFAKGYVRSILNDIKRGR